MCVLTYIPTNETDFIVTHNRDETLKRPKAFPPQTHTWHGYEVTMPQDALAGGTWIASSKAFTLCLLNGAFEKHTPQPPYKQSRGQIIPDFFRYGSVESFCQHYDFEGIENFTLIVFVQNSVVEIHEIRWDGKQLFSEQKAVNQAHIWSSATLYPLAIRQQRAAWLADFLEKNPHPTPEHLLNFHLYGGTGDKHNDMRINRHNNLVTQCIVQISYQNHEANLTFYDLLADLKV